MGTLFGTDGIRGVANQYPITAEMALRVGKTAAFLFSQPEGRGNSILVGQDTRQSSDMLAHGILSGICAMGVGAAYVKVMPTPAVACLTASSDAAAGIMISASHNPYTDNGIKMFDQNGFKFASQAEEEFEHYMLYQYDAVESAGGRNVGTVSIPSQAAVRYENHLKQAVSPDFSLRGMKIVMDCANGAAFAVAPELFAKMGATVIPLCADPDGININDACGSQHPGRAGQKVVETKSDLGLSFDGDADRLIAVDETGRAVSGDAVLAICAKAMKQRKALANNLVVTTVMSNVGLGVALKDMGIDHVMTDVGDRHVISEMIARGAVLGGEDSGHTIFLAHHTTGDGILTALKLIEAMKAECAPLSRLAGRIPFFPQVLLNVAVTKKPNIAADLDIQAAIRSAEERVGREGRVLVRYSGTRPLCRVMVSGASESAVQSCAREIVDVISSKIG